MSFNKYTILALLAAPVVAHDRNLRVSRDLTVCPTDVKIDLNCTVLKQEDGIWNAVGNVSAGNTLYLEGYDPLGCYNIKCQTSDEVRSAKVVYEGFVKAGSKTYNHTSFDTVSYLSGRADGNGCSTLAESCSNLHLTIQSQRTYPGENEGAVVPDDHICAKLEIACAEKVVVEDPCPEFACAKCGQILECYVEAEESSAAYKAAKQYIESSSFCPGAKTACGGQQCAQKQGLVVYPASQADPTCPTIGGFKCKAGNSLNGGNVLGAGLSNWNTYKVCTADGTLECGTKCESGTCGCEFATEMCEKCY